MHALLFGKGNIGRTHHRILTSYPQFNHIKVTHIPHPYDWDQIARLKGDVALICNPTKYHLDTAIRAAYHGMHCFIEKPLGCGDGVTNKLDCLHKLSQYTEGTTVYTAYPLRFCTPVIELKKSLFVPQDPESINHMYCLTNIYKWRQSGGDYSLCHSTGGGALLELSHEIDLAAHLFGPIIRIDGVEERVAPPESPISAETYLSLRVIHESRAITRIVLDIEFRAEIRGLFIGDHHYVTYRAYESAYVRQLEYFFDNLGNPDLMNGLQESIPLLKAIMKFRNTRLGPLYAALPEGKRRWHDQT